MNWKPGSLVALVLVAAGCIGTDAKDPPQPDVAEDQGPLEPAPEPVEPTVVETPRVENETRTNFLMAGCLNPRILFVLDPEYAQSLVPPPFVPADVTRLTQFTGIPVGSPADAGRAVGGYDLLACSVTSLDNQPAAFSQVGVMVEPPDLGNRSPVTPAMYDLYLLAFHTDRPAWQEMLLSSGFAEDEVPLATTTSTLSEVALGNKLGAGTVNDAGALAAVDYFLPTAGRDLLVDARYWHVAENGTFYFDFHLSEQVHAGTVNTCTHAAGSVFSLVSGTTLCGNESRFAAVGVGTQVAGTAFWLPNVFPAA